VEKVREGSNLVTQSGATLEEIVGAVKKVNDIVAGIAAASLEQSAGIEQVNKAVMQMDEGTQQNAALVEQTSAASQSMADQARTLNESMQRYRVNAVAGIALDDEIAPATEVAPVVERRKASRPWTDKSGKREAPAARPDRVRVAKAANPPAWKEF
jgi:methyl-accepting chemotaxis protein